MAGRTRRVGRIVAATGLLAAGVAVALAGGCAGGAPSPASAPKLSSATPAWRVDAFRRTLPAVLFVSGRELGVQRLDSATASTLWTAPAETSPTILAVDQPGGRIAVLLRASTGATYTVGRGYPSIPPRWRDAGIAILSADGSVRELRVTAASRRVNGSESGKGYSRSFEGTATDLVTSGAFVGPDLVLATSRPTFHYPVSGTPLRITPRGAETLLTVESKTGAERVQQLLQLPNGSALLVSGVEAIGGSVSNVALAQLRANQLSSSFVSYQSGGDAIGSAEGTAAFTQHEGSGRSEQFVVTSLDSTGWRSRAVNIWSRIDPSRWGFGGPVIGSAQAGPQDQLLAPATFTGSGHRLPSDHTPPPPTFSPLVPFSIESTLALEPTRVKVLDVEDERSPTWTYVAGFGR